MNVHLINPSHVSFGVGVITPRWLYVLASATPAAYGAPVLTDEQIASALCKVDRAVKAAVLDRVDHYDLSATVPALAGVITTGENLARTFWEWLEGALPPGSLRRVTLVETANNVFEYCGESAPAR